MMWNGHPLPHGPMAISIATFQPSPTIPPQPLFALAGTPHDQVAVAQDQLSLFLTVHHDRVFICEHAAAVHWLLHAHFQGDGQLRQQLWLLSREYRLWDVVLFDQLVSLAEDGHATPSVSLPQIVRQRCDLAVDDVQQLGQRMIVSNVAEFSQLPVDVQHRAFQIPWALHRVAEVLQEKCSSVARACRTEQEATRRFGPLGLGIQVQGAIALHEADQTIWRVNSPVLPEVLDELQTRREESAQQLITNRETRRWFRISAGQSSHPREAYDIHPAALEEWLEEVLETLTGPHGLPLPGPSEATAAEQWGVLRYCHPLLKAWADYVTDSRGLHWLNSAPDLRLSYGVLPRMESEPPASVLQRIVGRNLLESVDRMPCLRVSFPDLELRTFAAVLEHHYGDSHLASLYHQGQDALACLADNLAACANENAWALNGLTEQDWLNVGRAFLLGISLKLSPETSRAFVCGKAGLELPAEASRELYACVLRVFPELGQYTQGTTFQQLAAHLEQDEDVCQQQLRDVAVADIHRSIRGYKMMQQHQEIYLKIRQLNRSPRADLSEVGAELYEKVFGETSIGMSGRVRGKAPFSEMSAEHLDMADDVVKLAIYATVAEGYCLLGVCGNQFSLNIPSSVSSLDEARETIETVVQQTVRGVIPAVSLPLDVNLSSAW